MRPALGLALLLALACEDPLAGPGPEDARDLGSVSIDGESSADLGEDSGDDAGSRLADATLLRDTGPADDASTEDAHGAEDATGAEDAAFEPDAEPVTDAEPFTDAESLTDGEVTDADSTPDAETPADTGDATDAGDTTDAEPGMDAETGEDATVLADATVFADAAPARDAEPAPDLGTPGTGDVWIELDYRSAYTPRSPRWSFSNTPGWGAAQWAMEGDTWPEAWDRFNNMTVGSDPIGNSLIIGSSSQLQLMIGLEELVSYQSMTVQLEGRSRSTCCSLTFHVTNPLNNCGSSATMSNDWTPDIIDVPLGTCLLTGPSGRIEAVRIAPQSGTMALLRMRVTLHGAVW